MAKSRQKGPLRKKDSGGGRCYWTKTIDGKERRFGKVGDVSEKEAVAEYSDFMARRRLGMETDGNSKSMTVRELFAEYLNQKELDVEAGSFSQRSLESRKRYLQWAGECIGGRGLDTLTAKDFTDLRNQFPTNWAPATVDTYVDQIKLPFNWAYEQEFLEKPMRFGSLKRTSSKAIRKAKRDKPKKLFTRDEILRLIDKAGTTPMAAFIMLGINAGYGPTDCAVLRVGDISESTEFLRLPRRKTGEQRCSWLWPETREIIAKTANGNDFLFRTATGLSWEHGTSNLIPPNFQSLRKSIGLKGNEGKGFYSLRHTFGTKAATAPMTLLQPTINLVMGHTDASMAANYREEIPDDFVKQLCEHVRSWLFP